MTSSGPHTTAPAAVGVAAVRTGPSRAPRRGGRFPLGGAGCAGHRGWRRPCGPVTAAAGSSGQPDREPSQSACAAVRTAPGCLPRTRGGRGRVEAEDDAQQDRPAWSGGEPADSGRGPAPSTAPLQRRCGCVRSARQLQYVVLEGGGPRLAPLLAQVVQRPVAGDRRRPAAEGATVAPEAAQVAGDLQPRLRGHVPGVPAHQSPYEAEQPRLNGSGRPARTPPRRRAGRAGPQRRAPSRVPPPTSSRRVPGSCPCRGLRAELPKCH